MVQSWAGPWLTERKAETGTFFFFLPGKCSLVFNHPLHDVRQGLLSRAPWGERAVADKAGQCQVP